MAPDLVIGAGRLETRRSTHIALFRESIVGASLRDPRGVDFALTVRATCDLAVSGLPDLIDAALDDGFALGATPNISDHAWVTQEWSEWWTVMSSYRSGLLNAPTFVPLDPPGFDTLTDPLRQARIPAQ